MSRTAAWVTAAARSTVVSQRGVIASIHEPAGAVEARVMVVLALGSRGDCAGYLPARCRRAQPALLNQAARRRQRPGRPNGPSVLVRALLSRPLMIRSRPS